MYTIEVIPLHKSPFTDSLSYFSKVDYEAGTLVMVPIRNRETMAIVTSSNPVSSTKTALRMASFSLRKLPPQKNVSAVPKSLQKLAQTAQTRYPATLGLILYQLLPVDIKLGQASFPKTDEPTSITTGEIQLLQATTHDRYVRYQSIIRTNFAQNASVLLVLPTAAYVAEAYEDLAKGIEKHVICLSSHINKKKRLDGYEKIYNEKHPVLIITTPQYAYIERADTKTIIIEKSGSSHWQDRTRPYLNHNELLQTLSIQTGRTCIVGDTLPRSEDEYARRNYTVQNLLEETPKRLVLPSKFRIIQDSHKPTKEEPFKLFFDETVKRIQTVLNKNENVFFYAARRGLAPIITCFDCGTIAKSPESGAPYSLLKTQKNGEEYRWFVDRNSGKRIRAADTCENCGSWRLKERGIGIQNIQDACRTYFPNTPVICFDNTTANTPKKAKNLQAQMRTAKGCIFLGTVSILPYLTKNITTTCVTSLEAAQSIPSWRADEMLFRLFLELREKSAHELIVQTRSEPPMIISHIEKAKVEKFYDEELELREMLNYPPFTNLFLLTWQETTNESKEVEKLIEETLTNYQKQYYTNPLSHPQKKTRHALLRIKQADWPDPKLIKLLQELPPYIKIQRNPDRIV